MADEGRASLEDVLELQTLATSRGIRVSVPAKVLSVDRVGGRVSVEPQLLRPRTDPGLDPDRDPVLADIPVVFPSSSTAEVSFAVDEGDYGSVHFADWALGAWLTAGEVVPPGPGGSHGLPGAYFVPGLQPDNLRPSIPAEGVVVAVRGDDGRIEVVPGEVRVGAGATSAAILDTYLTAENTYLTAQSTWLAAMQTWLTAGGSLNPLATTAFQTATTTYQAAVTAFRTGLNSHKTSIVRIK